MVTLGGPTDLLENKVGGCTQAGACSCRGQAGAVTCVLPMPAALCASHNNAAVCTVSQPPLPASWHPPPPPRAGAGLPRPAPGNDGRRAHAAAAGAAAGRGAAAGARLPRGGQRSARGGGAGGRLRVVCAAAQGAGCGEQRQCSRALASVIILLGSSGGLVCIIHWLVDAAAWGAGSKGEDARSGAGSDGGGGRRATCCEPVLQRRRPGLSAPSHLPHPPHSLPATEGWCSWAWPRSAPPPWRRLGLPTRCALRTWQPMGSLTRRSPRQGRSPLQRKQQRRRLRWELAAAPTKRQRRRRRWCSSWSS